MESIVRLTYGAGEEGIGWVELLARADEEDRYAEATIEGAIRDLGVFGVLWRKGAPPRRGQPEGRRVLMTDLGAVLWEVEGTGVLESIGLVGPWNPPLE